jgi:predicted deacylase
MLGPLSIGGAEVRPGEVRDVFLKISETYAGGDVAVPIRVIRASADGPSLFVTAAIHGDELCGTGIIHELLYGDGLDIIAGTLILIPVVNVFGFESHDRYLPDRRDLNRQFPGSPNGSLASRVAHTLMEQIVRQCEWGIDLHSASQPRTNHPNVRGKLSDPRVRRLAEAFGCELVVEGAGPVGSLRREACKCGCATILLEAGEPLKVESDVLEVGARGIRNALIDLGMLAGAPVRPPFQVRVRKTTWVRAKVGGILRFHIRPGELVEAGQPIATNYTIFGRDPTVLASPVDGVVLGITTIPLVKPGEPICHVAIPTRRLTTLRKTVAASRMRAALEPPAE